MPSEIAPRVDPQNSMLISFEFSGTVELSPGDEIAGSPTGLEGALPPRSGPRPKLKRPRIINKPRPARPSRPSSPSQDGDWGERCVEVYERINQIGEGTYGLVSACEFSRGET